MFRKPLIAASISLALGLSAAQVQAQEQERQQAATPPPSDKLITEQSRDHMLSGKLQGMMVLGPDGSTIGYVDSLLFNEDNEIVGAVVSIGGFMGFGAEQVALNWDEFKVDREEGAVHTDVTGQQLEAAPRFKTLAAKKADERAAMRERERQQQRQQQTPSRPGQPPGSPQQGQPQGPPQQGQQ